MAYEEILENSRRRSRARLLPGRVRSQLRDHAMDLMREAEGILSELAQDEILRRELDANAS